MTTIHEIDCDEVLARGLTTIARSADQHWVFGHNGAAIMSGAWLLRDGSLPESSAARLAKRLRKTLEQLGPTFVKFGQLLATRVDLFSEPFIEELARLHSEAQPFPTKQAREEISEITGPLEKISGSTARLH